MLSFAGASSFGWYLLACLLWGCSSGVSGAAPAAYVADTAKPGMTAATLGAYRTIADSGYVVGPLVLGAVADVASGRAALLVCAALSLAAGAVFVRFAPETLTAPVPVPESGAALRTTFSPEPTAEPIPKRTIP